ncbi:DUF6911 family protein [Neisseria sp. Ec49-e6-T10]|uniref:DUF6911 family protein n=1 Tax=Neisseria sp. Ec49-e6-T10 TaxID=3140744 RepID=UPI003EBE23A9
MIINYEIVGGYRINGESIRLPLTNNPPLEKIINYLSYFQDYDGTLTLSNDQEENLKPYNMTLYSDNKRYLILFATLMDDGDIEVRTFNDNSGSQEFISILGEPYAKASTVTDFSLVIKVFKEFYQIGDVNRELLA